MNASEMDRETLAAVFASRVALAKRTPEQAQADALLEHQRTEAWVKSPSTKEASFLWFCDEFDLDAGAVRKAIRERRG